MGIPCDYTLPSDSESEGTVVLRISMSYFAWK
jgi:hypothetical protein